MLVEIFLRFARIRRDPIKSTCVPQSADGDQNMAFLQMESMLENVHEQGDSQMPICLPVLRPSWASLRGAFPESPGGGPESRGAAHPSRPLGCT